MNDFTQTKFFRLLLDLQRLAQFNSDDDFYRRNTAEMFGKENLSDEQFYRRFDFTSEMIQFTETKYHDARH
ncbi:MAG: hypothetical protein IKE46_08110 [Selenomonadaceae bacterium]|nr:hypothetical protein [Selenomonadaceae bacterium]